jgi:hypothetical protein
VADTNARHLIHSESPTTTYSFRYGGKSYYHIQMQIWGKSSYHIQLQIWGKSYYHIQLQIWGKSYHHIPLQIWGKSYRCRFGVGPVTTYSTRF